MPIIGHSEIRDLQSWMSIIDLAYGSIEAQNYHPATRLRRSVDHIYIVNRNSFVNCAVPIIGCQRPAPIIVPPFGMMIDVPRLRGQQSPTVIVLL